MPRGGYQRPSSPAPVSGPGKLSQRTDGGPGAMQGAKYVSGLPYGEGQEFQDVQTMAPMEAAAKVPSASSVGAAPAQLVETSPVVGLNAPTQRLHEPVTAGIDMGPGAGSGVLPDAAAGRDPYSLAEALRPLLEHDTNGDIRVLYHMAVNNGW